MSLLLFILCSFLSCRKSTQETPENLSDLYLASVGPDGYYGPSILRFEIVINNSDNLFDSVALLIYPDGPKQPNYSIGFHVDSSFAGIWSDLTKQINEPKPLQYKLYTHFLSGKEEYTKLLSRSYH